MPSLPVLILTGPTGSGKTDASIVSYDNSYEIVNIDMGQFYAPLVIGTAKPDWRNMPVKHRLFDILHEPRSFSVIEYRKVVKEIVEEILSRKKIPVLVGGSLFYIKSLFFPPYEISVTTIQNKCFSNYSLLSSAELWKQLSLIDSERAQAIHVNDRYRIMRALSIYYETGEKASSLKPVYNPCFSAHIIYLKRNRSDLYKRIDERVRYMINNGWIEEVKGLSSEWQEFASKKLIGYDDVINFINNNISLEKAIESIQKKTRNYAKRQELFWRSFCKNVASRYTREKQSLFLEEVSSDQLEEKMRTFLAPQVKVS